MDTAGTAPSRGVLSRIMAPFVWVWDFIWFIGTLLYVVVTTPIFIVFSVIRTIVQITLGNLPLVILAAIMISFTVTWVDTHSSVFSGAEVTWRCTIVPFFLAPLPTAVRALVDPYEDAVCYSNAFGFSTRILSKKPFIKILVEDVNNLSLLSPVFALLKGAFDGIARLVRWVLTFWRSRVPIYSVLLNVDNIIEILLRTLNALCRDLHPGFFFLGRVITNQRLKCALDNFVNGVVARIQYWLTFVYNLITTILQLIFDTTIFDFGSFIDEFRTSASDVSPLITIPSERISMSLIHIGEFLNEFIQSLVCTIITEIDLHKNDSTLVNGTIQPTHTNFKLAENETYIHEIHYETCMTNKAESYYNIFGGLAHLSAAVIRLQFAVERIFPGNLFRIAWEFLFLSGPISDDGTGGYDINTPIPNNSTRFLLNVTTIDVVWDTIRRPLDTLRTRSTIEQWPYTPLYGSNSVLYGSMENTTTPCAGSLISLEPQENLFCAECKYNTTEANVVSQIEILARNIDNVLEPLINRRIMRPILFDIFGGILRFLTAIAKWIIDNPRHIFAGIDEASIFYARQNYYDVIFDELAGKPHELGGIYGGIVNFFVEIHPSLHILPKFFILPLKIVTEFVRNIIRLIPMIFNTIIGIGNAPTYGPRINEFFCLTPVNSTCINIEEQFLKWIRIPRSISQVQLIINALRRTMSLNTLAEGGSTIRVFNLGINLLNTVHIDQIFNEIANNYTSILYGDVYDPTITVDPDRFGWLECIRYAFSPSFINSFIPNPLDHITAAQFPDITSGFYYACRVIAEVVKTLAEGLVALVQTIIDLFSNTDPHMPAVLLRWLACTEPELCIPLLQALSDTEDFVQTPCRLFGETFINIPCLCNITSSLGLGANQLLRASLNVELAASQLIVCVTEFPDGVDNANLDSKACYTIVFDRVIDIFTKAYNATNDTADFGAGIGCLIGLADPVPCGSSPSGQRLSLYSSDLGYYGVQFLLSIPRSIIQIVKSFFIYIRGVVVGSSGNSPGANFSFRFVVETVLNETVTPLVGDPNNNNTIGFVQSFGFAFSCAFGNSICTINDPGDLDCPGSLFITLGNNLRDVYNCLIQIIGNFIGFWENLIGGRDVGENITGFFEGILCLISRLVKTILSLFVSIIGGFLDAIFGTGTTIRDFLQLVADGIGSVIDLLKGLFFDIGEALDCSTCWSDCLRTTWDNNHIGVPAPQSACNGCYCECQCQRPTLRDYPCRVDWDDNGVENDNEDPTQVNNNLGLDCPAAAAAANLESQSINCWRFCVFSYDTTSWDVSPFADGTGGVFPNTKVVPESVCGDCYCKCKVQPADQILLSLGTDTSKCYKDWDGDSTIETAENFTVSGSILGLPYTCPSNDSVVNTCLECWWHTLNGTMTPGPGTTIAQRNSTIISTTTDQCLDGWCKCQCQQPDILTSVLKFNVGILDANIGVLRSINLLTPLGRIAYIGNITALANASGQYYDYTGFNPTCIKDWDNDGTIVHFIGTEATAPEVFTALTPYGNCPQVAAAAACMACWDTLLPITVGPGLNYLNKKKTSDRNCYDGWCICQCSPDDSLRANLELTQFIQENCSRDWDGDGALETYIPPEYFGETFTTSPIGFPTCGTDSYQQCTSCWFNAILSLNPNTSNPITQAMCDSAWCDCQCQIPDLVVDMFLFYYSSPSNGFCRQDWDGNLTIASNDNISISESFPGTLVCTKKRTVYDNSEDSRKQIWESLIETERGRKWALDHKFLLLEADPSALTTVSAQDFVMPGPLDEETINLINWYSGSTVLGKKYALPAEPISPALGRAQNMYKSLTDLSQAMEPAPGAKRSSIMTSNSDSLCTRLLLDIYKKNQGTPTNFESVEKLMIGASYSDRAMFSGCYAMMVAPSLFNNRTNGVLNLPQYLLFNKDQIKWWMQSSVDMMQSYTSWSFQNGNIEVSPTLLNAVVNIQQNNSALIYNSGTLSNSLETLKRFTGLFHRDISGRKKRSENELIAVNTGSFSDAMVLGGFARNPNLRVFANQLDDYVSSGRTSERVAKHMSESLRIAQQSTVLDGIIHGLSSVQSAITVMDPVTWSRIVQSSIRAAANTPATLKLNVKMISDSFYPGTFNQSSTQFGPLGTRNNPNFNVLSGNTLIEKVQSAVSFYGRVWDNYKRTEVTRINSLVRSKVNTIQKSLESSETMLRMIETYQIIQKEVGAQLSQSNIVDMPPMEPRIANWVLRVRTKQNIVPVSGLEVGVSVRSVLNGTQCNVTRCFDCKVLDTIITEIRDQFQFCIDRDNGLDVVKRLNFTTIDDVINAADTPDNVTIVPSYLLANSFFFGFGRYLNMIAVFLSSTNQDPFSKTGEPLGILFYIQAFAPIPFVGYCDRDIHTMCQFGFGFQWGLLALVILTLGALILWIFVPPVAGFLSSLIGILGYLLFVITVVLVVSWGMNPLCLGSTPPELPECAVQSIAETFEAVIVACPNFLKSFVLVATQPFTCPACPISIPFIDCRTDGFHTYLDVVAFGLNRAFYLVGISFSLTMDAVLDIQNPEHQQCFWILFLGSLLFWVALLILAFVYLIPLIFDIIFQLQTAWIRLTSAKFFARQR